MSEVTVASIDEKIEEIVQNRKEAVERLHEAESAAMNLRKMIDRQDGALTGLVELKNGSSSEEQDVTSE